jgi:hypothetical protein
VKIASAMLGVVALLLFAGATVFSFLPIVTPSWIEQICALLLFTVVLLAARYGCRGYGRIPAGRAYSSALVGMFCGVVCSGLGALGTMMYFDYGLPRPAWFAGSWLPELFEFAFAYAPLTGAAAGIAIGVLVALIGEKRRLSI